MLKSKPVAAEEWPMITVDEMMTSNAKTLSANDSLADVQALLKRYNCHHVPIVNHFNELDGLVSQRDVLRITESSLLENDKQINAADIKISDFMTTDVFTIRPETSLRKAAIYIRTQRYGCLPVIKNKQLVGIITDSDFVNIAIDLLEQLESAEPIEED
jgi:CBS domain-containing membrane protein